MCMYIYYVSESYVRNLLPKTFIVILHCAIKLLLMLNFMHLSTTTIRITLFHSFGSFSSMRVYFIYSSFTYFILYFVPFFPLLFLASSSSRPLCLLCASNLELKMEIMCILSRNKIEIKCHDSWIIEKLFVDFFFIVVT